MSVRSTEVEIYGDKFTIRYNQIKVESVIILSSKLCVYIILFYLK